MKKQIDFVRVHHNKFSNHYWQVTVSRKSSKPRTYDPTNASLERINQLQESDNLDFWMTLKPDGKSEIEIYP